ncbi:hypothetical protein WR25_06737 [Diploscapter pachys]|uniref:Uncharacterized protein n=1 Tax=Diploscapter pachys TaxID=2018661 RepID=A0A2A2M2U8_9BILA|nr:hypothetical protein WR25_06737 [Diploscapter pachys]
MVGEQRQHLIFLARQMHLRARAFDAVRGGIDRHLARAHHTAALRLATPERDAQAGEQFLAVERLGHVIVRAEVECGDLVLGRIARGDDQQRDPRRPRDDRHQLQPVPPRQPQIEQHRIRRVLRHRGQRRARIGGVDHVVAGALQRLAEQPPDRRLIIHHQHPRHQTCPSTIASRTIVADGKTSVNRAPAPSSRLAASTPTPIASANALTIARPRPVPPADRSDPSKRRNVSKIALSAPGGRPGPSSTTDNRNVAPRCAPTMRIAVPGSA